MTQTPARTILLVLSVGLGFGSYFVARYLGLWADSDTSVFARDIIGLTLAERISYDGSYSNGYAYPLWATVLYGVTGLRVGNMLQLFTPFVGTLFLALFSFVTYRALLESSRLAAVAASSLFLVPEMFFTVSRGNHEKLTVSLTLLALFCILKSYREMAGQDRRLSVLAAWVTAYYLCAFTLVSLNIFLGSSLIIALTLSFVGMGVAHRFGRQVALNRFLLRFGFIILTSWLIVLLVSWYVYPKAGNTAGLLGTALERFSALFLAFSPEESSFEVSSPYVTRVEWASPFIYSLLSSFRWLMFASSFAVWLAALYRFWRRPERTPLGRLFLLALYGAFGFQIALAVPMDFVGLDAGSNLQVRAYTYFVLFAVPMFTLGVNALLSLRLPRPVALGLRVLTSLAVVFYITVSLLKATLDPLVSNRWLFFRAAEIEAVRFWDQRMDDEVLVLDPASRTAFAYSLVYPELVVDNDNQVIRRGAGIDPNTAFASELTRTHAEVWQVSLSPLVAENRIYDNGEAQLYRRVARTPFQN